MKNKKRLASLCIAAALTASLSACGTLRDTDNEQKGNQTTNSEEGKEASEEENTDTADVTSQDRILIA